MTDTIDLDTKAKIHVLIAEIRRAIEHGRIVQAFRKLDYLDRLVQESDTLV